MNIQTSLMLSLLPGLLLGRVVIAGANAESPLKLESFPSHSRLAFKIDESVEPVWRSTSDGFELLLKGYWLSDLGAPLGNERE